MREETLIKVDNLNKKFGMTGGHAICNLSLSINEGELFCLVGANGAGKTTLIKILCNLITPTSGQIYINGSSLLADPKKMRAKIGLVTGDERSFYWRLTGRENLDFFAALYDIYGKARRAKIEELFELMDIKDPDKRFQEYPSGIKQRLSIARALLNDPQILFIDELTKGLDPTSARDLRILIKEKLVKEQKKTVFFSTHNLHEVEELADRVAFMAKGMIVAVGTLNKLRESINKPGAGIEEIYDYFMNKKD